MLSGPWRKSAWIAAAAGVIVATALLLDIFARREFADHLRDQAAYALALAATGGTPHEWRLRTADDVVAGHPFGPGVYAFDQQGLRLQPTGDVEVGLTLARPVDLRAFPLLRLSIDAESAGAFRIVVRETLESPELVSDPKTFLRGEFREALDLRAMSWNSPKPPATAAMLRVRVASGTTLLLRGALLQRPSDYVPLDLSHVPAIVDAEDKPAAANAVYRLPFAPSLQQAGLAALASRWVPPQPPLILLQQRGRVEQQIALRNAVYAALPSAILIPGNAYEETFATARQYAANRLHPVAPGTEWWMVVAFGACLLFARWRPPRGVRARALVEIVLTLAAPMWLVVSGRIDGNNLHSPQTVLIGFSLIYAISLVLHPSWRLNGNTAVWLAAVSVVVFAILVGLAAHVSDSHTAGPVVPSRFALYLGWALLQQFLICAICTERWRIVTGHGAAAVYLGALCFALLHTPNATLMLATFAGGLAWCAIWLHYRALLPIAVSHAASALALSALLPADVLHSAEVSVRFFH